MKKELNHKARDSLVYQITEAMEDLRQKGENIQVALSYMEQARNSSYTESMAEVKIILEMAVKRLSVDIQPDQTKVLNLAGVAEEIHKYEKEVDDE